MTTEQDSIAPNVSTRLRAEVFTELCAERGLNTKAAKAGALGVSEKTISRLIAGEDAAGIVAPALAIWRRCSFRSLFAVIDNATGEEMR